MLVIGDKDETRYHDNLRFYNALLKAGSPAKLVVYEGEGHEMSSAETGVKHVNPLLFSAPLRPAGGEISGNVRYGY